MHPLIFFDAILIEPPVEKIYRRLGYRKGTTAAPPGKRAEVDKYISEALSLIRLQGAGLRLSLMEKTSSRVALAGEKGEEVFNSRRLARFLKDCDEAVLMGATAGGEIAAAIEDAVAAGDFSRGVVFDAAASETVDAALDWIMAYFAGELRRENKILTANRFSAGYGDFLLENQEVMFRLLKLERRGVSITPTFLLLPEKSVTAIAGVRWRQPLCRPAP